MQINQARASRRRLHRYLGVSITSDSVSILDRFDVLLQFLRREHLAFLLLNHFSEVGLGNHLQPVNGHRVNVVLGSLIDIDIDVDVLRPFFPVDLDVSDLDVLVAVILEHGFDLLDIFVQLRTVQSAGSGKKGDEVVLLGLHLLLQPL